MRAALLASLVLVLVACQPRAGAFFCYTDEECTLGGQAGTCEVSGWCAFLDPGCESGKRYGEWAGDGLSNRCVAAPGLDPDEPDAGPPPDAGPEPTCGAVGQVCCATGKPCEGSAKCDDGTCTCPNLGAPTAGTYGRHACVSGPDGQVYCWGADDSGQIGTGSVAPFRAAPAAASGLVDATQVAAGSEHTCALAGGAVWCWGDNAFGQLGKPGGDRPVPQRTSLDDVAQVEAGGSTTCAVTSAGAVFCWGRNDRGQVGDGTTEERNKPAAVTGLGVATQVASGATSSCARLADGTAWCWGAGIAGQLGNDTTVDSPVPVKVAIADVAQVAVGDDQSCARKTDGTVWCWGDNAHGALGDGTITSRDTPVQVLGLASVTDVDVADEFACARKIDGTVWCWGWNDLGQLGLGAGAPEFVNAPRQVPGIADATSVAAGGKFVCVRRSLGVVACWGAGTEGQIGDGAATDAPAPRAVALSCP